MNKRGALTGGYTDSKRSRLMAQAQIVEAKAAVDALSAEAKAVAQAIDGAEADVTAALSELSKQQERKNHVRNQYAQIEFDLRKAQTDLDMSVGTLAANVSPEA